MSASYKRNDFRRPGPLTWTATSLLLIYMVWCIVVPTLTSTGHLYSVQSVECTDDTESKSRRTYEQSMVCLWSSLNLGLCIMLLLKVWMKNNCFWVYVILFVIVIAIIMIYSFDNIQKNETQGMENLKRRYLALLPLTHNNTRDLLMDTNCDMLTNIQHWQTEFQCCGLESYQDWSPVIPGSCLCEGEDDTSGCVGVGDTLVYEKPCLPIVVSLAAKQRSTFQIILTAWVVIAGASLAILMLCIGLGLIIFIGMCVITSNLCWELKHWIDRICGRRRVAAVFIRKNNNNQTEPEHVEEQRSVTDDTDHTDDNPLIFIPLSLLRRLQEELDPPPVQHLVQNERCFCIDPPPRRIRPFYTVLVDDDSPLVPNRAVLVDAHKPTKHCYWEEGHRVFGVREIVWPQVKKQDTTAV